jgi:hypothetical protein
LYVLVAFVSLKWNCYCGRTQLDGWGDRVIFPYSKKTKCCATTINLYWQIN